LGDRFLTDFRIGDVKEHLLHERNIPKEIVLFVFERDLWACRSCNANTNIMPHHIYPRSQGRDHHPDNLVTLCFNCHRAIHDGDLILRVIDGNYFFGGKKRWRK